jgi:hypothetical protein
LTATLTDGAGGVTPTDPADEVPAALCATTVKEYDVPGLRPLNAADVPAVVWVCPPGYIVTVYPVIALPPSGGADQETLAVACVGDDEWTAEMCTPCGTPGEVIDTTGSDAPEAADEPTALWATTVNR